MDLSVVVPCFNEERGLEELRDELNAVLPALVGRFEVVFVDDGSTDGTADAASALGVRVIVHPENRGYGAALRSGIAAARMEWVLLADADLQFDLREVADFVALTGLAEALWGRRIMRQDRWSRRAASAAWNRFVRARYQLPMRDVDCGFKLIRRDILDRVPLEANGAMISVELAAGCRAAGARFAEVGVHHHPRRAGEQTAGRLRAWFR